MELWEEHIFEDRNKLYGSFHIRKKYRKYLFISFLIAIGVLLAPLLFLLYHYQQKEQVEDMPIVISVEFTHPVDIDNLLQEPPPPANLPKPVIEEKLPVITDSAKSLN